MRPDRLQIKALFCALFLVLGRLGPTLIPAHVYSDYPYLGYYWLTLPCAISTTTHDHH